MGRHARTNQLIEAAKAIPAEHNPMTVRQVYYQLVSRQVMENSRSQYQAVSNLLVHARKAGVIPWEWVEDRLRRPRTVSMWDGLPDFAETARSACRRDVWSTQSRYLEVWLEKDALAGVVYEETEPWDVPLMVTRGYPSLSYLYEAAEVIAQRDKPAFLYYFGDLDPSGIDITKTVERGIREFAPDAEIFFERVAVTPQQVKVLGLPTRPTKQTDSRSKNFAGESVEVDAIPAAKLLGLVRNCIEKHLDQRALARTRQIEAAERETLVAIQQQMRRWWRLAT